MTYIHDFCYKFLPKLLAGTRATGVYSSNRVALMGCLTAAVFFSAFTLWTFSRHSQYEHILYICANWLFPAIFFIIGLNTKARAMIANKIVDNIGSAIKLKKKNKNA
jgi:hypothetical protein